MTSQTALVESSTTPSRADGGADHFRPIQYLGSKVRLLDVIESAIDEVDPTKGSVLDLFSGSGVVGARLNRSRAVTAVDVQEYSRVLASALMTPARLMPATVERIAAAAAADFQARSGGGARGLLELEQHAMRAVGEGDPLPLCEILEKGSPAACRLGEGPDPGLLADAIAAASQEFGEETSALTLVDHYGGVYFSYVQALQLDCLLTQVRALPQGALRDTALAASIGAASEVVTSVGNHFAQPLRPRDRNNMPKASALGAAVRSRSRDVLAIFADRVASYAAASTAAHQATAIRGDYRSFLATHEGEVAVTYADPPYTREHYSRFYHVLETMVLGDVPDISTVTVAGKTALSRGLYRKDRHQSPFCIRTQAPDAFRDLFSGARRFDAPLVVSYSPYTTGTAARPESRLLRIPEVVELAGEHFGEVTVRTGGSVSHSKFNAGRLNGDIEREAEQLIVCIP